MSPLHPLLRRSLATGAAAAGAVVAMRAMAKPLPTDERRLLDWEAVRRIAHDRCGEPAGRLSADRAVELGARDDVDAGELAPLMEAVCQSVPTGFPRFTVLDRRGFIDTNLGIASRLLAPVEQLRSQLPESRVTALGRSLTSRYMGELFGFISKRVLGQYDPVLMLGDIAPESRPAASLYLVESNVAGFQRHAGIPERPLRRYLILHELTHAWQFGSHPWLRDHLISIMSDTLVAGLLEQLEQERSGRRRAFPSRATLQALPIQLRTQLGAVSRIQAVMSVLEGYSNFVMHRVGRENLEHFDELERAFHERSQQRSAFERVILAVTGMSMKLRQYDLGERFSEAVTEQGGLDLLNRVWRGPEAMPTMDELRTPQRWIARIG